MAKKNIVIIGGGSASAAFLKDGFGNHKAGFNLAVISSMADNGGSTGILRRELKVSALGALRKCLLALSQSPDAVKKMFSYRFEKGCLKGHAAGNIFMAALEKSTGSAEKALEISSKMLDVAGDILPVTFDDITLCAELENGKIIKGETDIDIPKHDGRLKIKKVFLNSRAKLNPKARTKILAADLVIIGPGDFYTTVIPNFLVNGVKQAVRNSQAKKVFVTNIVTKFGETNNFSVLDFARETEKYVGFPLDFAIYNSKPIPKKEIQRYKRSNRGILDFVSIDKNLSKKKFIGKNLALKKNPAFYDHKKLVKALLELI